LAILTGGAVVGRGEALAGVTRRGSWEMVECPLLRDQEVIDEEG